MSNNFPRQTSTTLWANFALGVVLLLFAVGVLHDAAAGQLVVWDELFTAERAREFTFQWPLTVRFNFEPTFRKPPLHYMVTAVTLRLLGDPELGTRLWSGIYGAGCVLLCAWWVRLVRPGKPWIGTVAAAWLSLNVLFFTNSRIGLLDTGMTFYLLLTIIGCEKARCDPRWWYLAAVGIGLGFLQKLPLGAAYALIAVAINWRNLEFRHTFLSRPTLIAGALATVLVVWWPAIQTLRYGRRFIKYYFLLEMLGRPFHPAFASSGRGGPGFYLGPLWSSWGALGICAAAVCMLLLFPFPIRRKSETSAAAFFCVGYLLIISVMISKYTRYLIPICPVLAGLLAAACDAIPKLKLRCLAIALLTFVGAIPMARALPLQRLQQAPEQLALAQRFERELLPGETAALIRAPTTADFLLSFLLFYGKLDRPVIYAGLERKKFWEPLLLGHESTAFLGIAHRTHWPEVSRAFRNARIVQESQRFIIFRADGTSDAQVLYRLTL